MHACAAFSAARCAQAATCRRPRSLRRARSCAGPGVVQCTHQRLARSQAATSAVSVSWITRSSPEVQPASGGERRTLGQAAKATRHPTSRPPVARTVARSRGELVHCGPPTRRTPPAAECHRRSGACRCVSRPRCHRHVIAGRRARRSRGLRCPKSRKGASHSPSPQAMAASSLTSTHREPVLHQTHHALDLGRIGSEPARSVGRHYVVSLSLRELRVTPYFSCQPPRRSSANITRRSGPRLYCSTSSNERSRAQPDSSSPPSLRR